MVVMMIIIILVLIIFRKRLIPFRPFGRAFAPLLCLTDAASQL